MKGRALSIILHFWRFLYNLHIIISICILKLKPIIMVVFSLAIHPMLSLYYHCHVQHVKFKIAFQHLSFTTSWGCWKHPLWIPGVRPMFLKPKLHKQSKNGFKTISCRRYPLMIFSKNCFSVQNNHQKDWMFCWFLNFYGTIYELIRSETVQFFLWFFVPKKVIWKNHHSVGPVIDCFEPIFRFLMQFGF